MLLCNDEVWRDFLKEWYRLMESGEIKLTLEEEKKILELVKKELTIVWV